MDVGLAAAAGLPAVSHPLFQDAQARYAAILAAQQTVLMERQNAVGDMDEIGRLAQEDVEEKVSDEVFAGFQHIEILPGCRPHPGDIVEAGSLAHLPLPQPTYPLADSLPPEMIADCRLSSLQLQGILYACQRHQLILPNSCRAGFFIGDGAGVGKGRQIAGIILDNYARGRVKHIWFSISTDLVVDARREPPIRGSSYTELPLPRAEPEARRFCVRITEVRDLTDIGCHIKVIEGCQQLDKETRVLGLPADFKDGVIFSTYATLVSAVQKGGALSSTKQSRLQQLVDWCGGAEFEGCLIFDECHKAKNFVPGKETASTKVALAVAHIQRILPKARVVYCSATGVTDVKNMAFMERLGLWGDGAPFKSFENFLDTVHKKGLGVAEMLAMEMKTSGVYVSRGLSFKQAEFMTVEMELTKEQIRMYDTAAHVWNEVRKSLVSAVERTNTSNNRVWASFWAAHQRFFKQLCLGIKVPAIVREAEKALDDGFSVVIGLQTTGEASLESEVSKNGAPLTGFVSLCREIFSRFVKQHFPTVIEGNTTGPPEDEWSVTAKQMLLGFAQQIELPNSPLDDIIDKLGGPDCVAEMTGRKGRMVRYKSFEQPCYEQRDSAGSDSVDSLNVRERNLFMEGKKLVAIISDAASTGISLHADLRCANTRRRVHITIELPWSADKAVQQLGRSHRSNQTSGPVYKLMTTNLGGERRFAASVARRLQSLGALTKGDRRAATGADLTEFNFDTPYGRSALRTMYSCICQKVLPPGVSLSSVSNGKLDLESFNVQLQENLTQMDVMEPQVFAAAAKVKDNAAGDVGKFLNRILGLSVKYQQLVFNYFVQCLEAHVQSAKKEGRYNEGLVDIMASSVEMLKEPREVFKEAASSSNPTKHVVLKVDRGMTWEIAVKRLENHPGNGCGFYRSRRDMWGKRLYALATMKEGSQHQFKIARPNTGVSSFEEERHDLNNKYIPMSVEDAEKGWREQYEYAADNCLHGSHCRTGKSCTVGARCYNMHLLCGGIMTMMSHLERTIAVYGPKLQLSKAESTLRVVRIQLNNGQRVVGIRYPELLIPLVEKTISEQKAIEKVLQNQAKQQMILSNGMAVTRPPAEVSPKPIQELVIEDVSAVLSKCLKKALTPPVTIKNFFKASTVKKSDSPSSLVSDSNSGKKNIAKVTSKKETLASSANLKKSNVNVKGAINIKYSNDGNEGDVFSTNNILPSASGGESPKVLNNNTKAKGLKRGLSSSSVGSAAKKAKQSNLMSSFAKQKCIKEEKATKVLSCPICNTQFKPGTSNSEVNSHIDNCLID